MYYFQSPNLVFGVLFCFVLFFQSSVLGSDWVSGSERLQGHSSDSFWQVDVTDVNCGLNNQQQAGDEHRLPVAVQVRKICRKQSRDTHADTCRHWAMCERVSTPAE